MTLELTAAGRMPPMVAAAAVVGRTALGLVIHGMMRPGQPASIDRTSGRVSAR
jgi:hypothetical protein